MRFHWSTAALLVVGGWGIGCYKPNIASGGLACADGSVPCPDGFHCANGRCYSGDAGPTCDSTPPTPSCTTAPATGQPCNANCDFGCSCGFCSVADGKTTCLTVTAGDAAVGDICDPGKPAPCQKGLYCRPECGSSDPTLGRCYKFCADASDCQICTGDGACQNTTCTVTETSTSSTGQPFSFMLCSQPTQQCSTLGATSGCPTTDSAFACYAQNDEAVCDCKGTITPRSTTACAFVGDCVPGYSCVQPAAGVAVQCLPACRLSSDCTPPSICTFAPGDRVLRILLLTS